VAAAAVLGIAGFTWHLTWGQTKKNEPTKPAEAFLPLDTIAYFRHDGSLAHRKEWENTAAYQSLVKSGLWQSAEKLVLALGKQNPDAEKITSQALPLFRQATMDGFSAAVRLMKTGDQFEPQLTVVLHKGAAKETDVFKLLRLADPQGREESVQGKRVLRGKLPGENQEWGCWSDSGHLVLTLGRDAIATVMQRMNGKTPDVRGSNLWRKNNQVPKDVTLMSVAWIDLEQINRLVKNVPLPPDPNLQPTPTVGELLEAFGANNLNNLVMQSGMMGKACWSQTRLETGTRHGVLKLVEARPFTLADLPPLPDKANNFSAVALNWLGTYDEGWHQARDFAKNHGQAEAFARAEEQWKKFQDSLGWSVRDDLLASLGQLHVFYQDPTNAIGGMGMGIAIMGMGIAIPVTDAAKIKKVIDQAIAQAPQGAPNAPQFVRATKQGREVISINFGVPVFPPVFPSVCVDEQWLVFGSTPQTVEAFLLRKDGKLPAWKPDEELAAALQDFPQQMNAISVSDPRTMVLGIGQAAPLVIAGLGAQIPGGIPREVMAVDFPSAELIAQPLFPNVSVMTVEDGKIAVTGRSSLPVLTGSDASSVAVVAVGVPLLLPAVQQAREAARRTQSRNNLKQIALALHDFQGAYDTFPPGTMPGPVTAEDRMSWQATILPYLEQGPLYNRLEKNQGWQNATNAAVGQTKISVFNNPGLGIPQLAGGLGHTDYAGVAGLGPDGPKKKLDDKGAGFFAYDRGTRIRDITDGTSNTLMTGEVSKDRGGWIQGGPATIRPVSQKPYINGPDGWGGGWRGGSHFGLADGSVRFISENIDPSVMEALTTIRGGEVVNP